jgi:hypothetical protein
MHLLIVLGVIAVASLAVGGLWGWLDRQAERRPKHAPRKARGPLRDGFCPKCGEPGTYLNKDGTANRRFHTESMCAGLFRERYAVAMSVIGHDFHAVGDALAKTMAEHPPESMTDEGDVA